ncbi:hypothetical protein Q4F19_07050 [Sphingomonas sp. BIUV-7]|uniref:Uncharacterized protein n=1 Tax=Sphingomonas natans TaxID=3063330 RepID=A0ABT8Y8C7_9SPHN|nr:hypothetical protein [Sphingomonas sp. BIUV-7]MDO6414133.1 hypothetical protein [Sphingomonas sp. BIUV-7]
MDDHETRAFLIAEELLDEHGDDVAQFLQHKIDGLTAAQDVAQLSAWFVIRNAVSLLLESERTLH